LIHQLRIASYETQIPLGKQVFDITKAECEPMVEPDGMADDVRGKPMTFICGFHPSIVAEIDST
jgi:hypothetical protein